MIKKRENYNAYMNAYMKERYLKRRQEAVSRLGGKCVVCGATHELEFDHIDPQSKVATIARMSSMSNDKFNAEIDKCQLLCSVCHKKKSKIDGSQNAVVVDITCSCGKLFKSNKSYAGHKAWCK